MKAIFTYPSNASTNYVDPDYLGTSTTNGFAKRVADVMNETYDSFDNPDQSPITNESDLSELRTFISQVHPTLSYFHNYSQTVTRLNIYHEPLHRLDQFAVHGATSNAQFQSEHGIFKTNTEHGLYNKHKVDVSGFTTTTPVDLTQYNGNSYYVEVLDGKHFRLHTSDSFSHNTALDLGTETELWTTNLNYSFGYDASISVDQNYIAVASPIYRVGSSELGVPKILVFKKDTGSVGDPYRLESIIDNNSVLGTVQFDTGNYFGYNQLGASGLKLNTDGTRMFAHCWDGDTNTAYIVYFTRSGTTWTATNTFTYTNQAQRIRFDINEAGDTLAVRTSGESGTNAVFEIHTESGGTWTKRVDYDLGVQFWGEVQLDASGDYCVVERAGSDVQFFRNNGTQWDFYNGGSWHTIAHGSIISENMDNDVIALWQSGGTVRLACSPWNSTEGAAPSFFDYDPNSDTLTLESEFVGNAARKFYRFSDDGEYVIGSYFDTQIPGSGNLTDFERKTWIYKRNGGTWTLHSADVFENDNFVDDTVLKLRDAVWDSSNNEFVQVNQEKHWDINGFDNHIRVVRNDGSTATRDQHLPNLDWEAPSGALSYGGATTITDTVTVTASSDEPYRYKATRSTLLYRGNRFGRYFDFNTNQFVVGHVLRTWQFIPAQSGSQAFLTRGGVPFYNTVGESLPLFEARATTNSSGYISSIAAMHPQYPGKFSSDHDAIALFYENPPNVGVAPPPTPADPAGAEDQFDEELEWDTFDADSGRVWPIHVKPRAIRLSTNNPTVTTRSQNGTKYVRDLGFQKLTLEVDYPPMTSEDFDEFFARLQKLRGGARPFYFNLLGTDGVNNVFSYKGTATDSTTRGYHIVNYIPDGSNYLLLEGFDSNQTGVIKYNTTFANPNLAPARQGDISFAQNEADANIYGEVKVRLTYPPAGAVNAIGERIYFEPARAVCTLVDDNTDFDIGDYRYVGFTIRMEFDEFK